MPAGAASRTVGPAPNQCMALQPLPYQPPSAFHSARRLLRRRLASLHYHSTALYHPCQEDHSAYRYFLSSGQWLHPPPPPGQYSLSVHSLLLCPTSSAPGRVLAVGPVVGDDAVAVEIKAVATAVPESILRRFSVARETSPHQTVKTPAGKGNRQRRDEMSDVLFGPFGPPARRRVTCMGFDSAAIRMTGPWYSG